MTTDDETIGQWQRRKQAQGVRIVGRLPHLKIDNSLDYHTKFVLVDVEHLIAIIYGQLEWHDRHQPRIDLTDAEIVKAFAEAP